MSVTDEPKGGAVMRRALVMITAAWLLLVAACVGQSDETAPVNTGPEGAVEAGDATDEPTPLDEFMGWGAEERDVEEWEAQEREIIDLVVACLAEQGFEYVEVREIPITYEDPLTDIDEEEGTRAFAEKYGYGQALSFEWHMAHGRDERGPDYDVWAAMTEAEQDAYGNAEGQCYDDAEREIRGEPEAWPPTPSPAVEEFWALEEELFEQIRADPRLVEARAEWDRCMAERGHAASRDALSSRMDELHASVACPIEAIGDTELDAMTNVEIEALERAPCEFDRTLLEEVRALEIAVALADLGCQQEIGQDLWDLRREVRRELEAEFIEEHRELLERMRDEMP